MGSFQQISLGVICLVAAFVFGNYVNNNPPLNQPGVADALSGEHQTGNVASRLPTDPYAGIDKQPAPLLTMNRPLTSRFSVPNGQPTPTASQTVGENSLPPPSQLSSNDRKIASPQTSRSFFGNPIQNLKSDPDVQIPDFSGIAAEINNSAIKLPRMGMPMHSPAESTAVATNPRSRLQELAGQFQSPNGQNLDSDSPWNQPSPNQVNVQPNRQAPSTELGKIASPEMEAPWNQQIKQPQGFTSSDFESKLNDNIFGLKNQPRTAAIAPAETATHRSWRENIQPDWPADQANEDPSRLEPMTNGGNLTFQNHVAAKPAVNHQFQSNPGEVDRNEPAKDINRQQNSGYQGSSSSKQTRTRLPFGLTDSARTQLVALRNKATSNIGLETSKFVDHVVEPGESLQSISTRYFGKPDYYLDIYIANRSKLRNPGVVQSGLTIRVPIYESP